MVEQPAPSAPRRVAAGKAGGRVYVLADDYYAVHDRRPGAPAPDSIFVLKGGQIAVFRRDATPPTASRDAAIVGPVYAAPDGPLGVPTGLLFVRFAEGTSAAGRRAELERAGLDLVQIPGYAPHTAWVRATGGDIGASLEKMVTVEALPGVENVEPQMLMESGRR